MLKELKFPGMDQMADKYQRLYRALGEEVGGNVTADIWNLYQETGLVYPKNGMHVMWGDKEEETGLSRGPIPHSSMVAGAEYVLGQRLKLSEGRELVLTGLTHDAYKRKEIESKDSPGTHQVQKQKLRDMFGDRVAYLAEMSGHTAMPTVLQNLGDLPTAVVFWTDNAVVGTNLQPAAEKCDYLDRAAETGRYPYNEEGKIIYGVPYFTFQRYLAVTLESSIAMPLGIQPTTELAGRVDNWVKEKFLPE